MILAQNFVVKHLNTSFIVAQLFSKFDAVKIFVAYFSLGKKKTFGISKIVQLCFCHSITHKINF